jgi:hypothetical protein
VPPDKRIEDNESWKKMKLEMLGFKFLSKTFPLYKPIIRKLGVDIEKLKEAFGNLNDLQVQAKRLMMLPDKFNDIFAERGFIAFEMLNIEIMEAAINVAQSGKLDQAEEIIVDYIEKNIETQMNWMMLIPEFRVRRQLLDLAHADHIAGRYHASVPVILMMADGLVNVYHPDRTALSSNDVRIDAWDTISAHSNGIERLLKKFRKTRKITREEPLSFPYRNGIIHGMDLGFNNRIVSVKSWALLFSLREWLIRAKEGRLDKQESLPAPSIVETLRHMQETEKDKDLLALWQPRKCTVPVGDIQEDTPEHQVGKFLEFLKRRNYGHAAGCLSSKYWKTDKAGIDAIKRSGILLNLLSYEILSYEDQAAAVTEVEVAITYKDDRGERVIVGSFRVLAENDEGKIAFWGKPNTNWRLLGPVFS